MKNNLFIVLMAVAAAATLSCSKLETSETLFTPVRLTAYTDASQVKTSLDGTSVLWDANDSISVFSESENSKFKILSLSEDKKIAVFEGSSQVPASSVAIYPYNSKATCVGDVVSGVVFPSVQEAVAGGFANGSNPSVAIADNSGKLYFKNLGALVSFTVTESDVDWVTIEANADICGTADVTVGETPSVSFTEGKKQVKLSGAFESGKTYFAVIAPSTVDTLKLIFHKVATGAVIEGTAKSSKVFVRNGNYSLGSVSIASEKWKKGIWDDSDLLAFGAAVTAGENIDAYKDGEGVVNMWRDVDLGNKSMSKSVIGHVQWGVSSNIYNVTTNESKVFKGVFDGKGNTVSGLSISISSLGNMMPAGLFGVVKDATIRNLNVTGTGVYAVATSSKVAIGPIVGLAINSKIENCTSNCTRIKARLKSSGSSHQRMAIGGIVGIINDCTVKNCTNNSRVGIINGDDSGSNCNTSNGADGGNMAGICAFLSGSSNTVIACSNNGQVGGYESNGTNIGGGCRIGGIVATVLKNSTVEDCVNNGIVEGTLKASSDKSSRTAGIASYIDGASSVLKNCENNGKVCYSTANGSTHYYGYCSGIAGQFNQAITVSGCKNYGDVLSDNFTETDSNYNASGIIIARPNTKAANITACIVGGRIGGYSDSSTIVTLSTDNYSQYISGDTADRRKNLVIKDCSFGTK